MSARLVSKRAWCLLVAAFLLLVGCDAGSAPPANVRDAPDPPERVVAGSLRASDQTSDGETIEVETVTVSGVSAFVAVRTDRNGEPGEVLGATPVAEGTSTRVSVDLDEQIITGTYWVVLHRDDGVVGQFEFPGEDQPLQSDGQVVRQQIMVSVEGSE